MTVHYDPESLLEAHPNIEETVYYAQYAHALLENKEVKKAKAVAEKGMMAHPEYLTGHLIYAHCLKATGNVAEAKKHFKVAFDLDHRCPRAIQELVNIAAEQQDAKEWKYYSHRLEDLGVTLEEPHWLDESTPEKPETLDKENTATVEQPSEPPEGDSKMVREDDPVEETSQAEAIANRENARGEEKSETDDEEDDASSHELNSAEPAEPAEPAKPAEPAEPAESTGQESPESPENPEMEVPHLDWVDDGDDDSQTKEEGGSFGEPDVNDGSGDEAALQETSASVDESESPDPAAKAEPSSPSDDSEDSSPEETPAEQSIPESGERQGEATIVEGDLPPEVVDSGPSEVEDSKPVEEPSAESAENLESRSREAVLSKDSATPTLAEIYFQQGVKQKALDLYRKLLEKQPDNQEFAGRCREIEASIREDLEKEEAPREAPKPRRGLRLRRRRR